MALRLRQEDYVEVEASMDYIALSGERDRNRHIHKLGGQRSEAEYRGGLAVECLSAELKLWI